MGDGAEFESPDAADTTVLVTGATGRVGRVLVRKLLLRGYKVRALVRQRDGGAAAAAAAAGGSGVDSSVSMDAGSVGGEEAAIPLAVVQVYGDVGDYQACRRAVEGVDKVRCAAGDVLHVLHVLLRLFGVGQRGAAAHVGWALAGRAYSLL